MVLRVLTSFKGSEIEPAVNSLDSNGIDLLMKYIYKGFEKPTENSSAILLQWHEKVRGSFRSAGSLVLSFLTGKAWQGRGRGGEYKLVPLSCSCAAGSSTSAVPAQLWAEGLSGVLMTTWNASPMATAAWGQCGLGFFFFFGGGR